MVAIGQNTAKYKRITILSVNFPRMLHKQWSARLQRHLPKRERWRYVFRKGYLST